MDHTYSYTLAFIRHKQARRQTKLVRAPTLVHSTDSHVATVTYQHAHTPNLTLTPYTSSLCGSQNPVFFADSRPSNVQSAEESWKSSVGSKIHPVATHAKRISTTMASLPCTASKQLRSTETLSPSCRKKISSDTVLLKRWINEDSQSMSQLTDRATNWFDLSWNPSSMNDTECEPRNLEIHFLWENMILFY
jgi:hypothetical protein